MKLSNDWIGYLEREFSTIKQSLKERLKVKVPEMTDLEPTNIFIILVDIFASATELLTYYIDNMAREVFVGTARRYSSILAIAKLLNYKVRPAISSSVDLIFTLVDSAGNAVEAQALYTGIIPIGTRIGTDNSIEFITTSLGTISDGGTNVQVTARQRTLVQNEVIGQSTGVADQKFLLTNTYEFDTIQVEINFVIWTKVKDLALSGGADTHFYVEVDADGLTYLIFGDNNTGAIPAGSQDIILSYYTTLGDEGNVDADSIINVLDTLTIPVQTPTINDITVNNANRASGGYDLEGIERVRKALPLSLRTLDRAVTRQDYIDVAKLAPGIDKAALQFECGKFIDIYVAPIGGGVASVTLLSDTKDFIDNRKTITTFTNLLPTGETYIGLDIEATGAFRVKQADMQSAISAALLDKYSSTNSDINLPVRKSDIIALIDNLPEIDFLELTLIHSVPYARPSNPSAPLDWTRVTLSGSTNTIGWRLVYDSGLYVSGGFRIYKDGQYIQQIQPAVGYSDIGGFNILQLGITAIPSGAVHEDEWEFNTYAYNEDLSIEDYTVPIIHPDLTYVNVTLTEQLFK